MITLLDTDVLIEVLKGQAKMLQKVRSFDQCAVSAVSAMELIFGAKNKAEVQEIGNALSELMFLYITEQISVKALSLMQHYSKSHGLAIPDALIAATAISEGFNLYTLNVKDFRFMDELTLCSEGY